MKYFVVIAQSLIGGLAILIGGSVMVTNAGSGGDPIATVNMGLLCAFLILFGLSLLVHAAYIAKN